MTSVNIRNAFSSRGAGEVRCVSEVLEVAVVPAGRCFVLLFFLLETY